MSQGGDFGHLISTPSGWKDSTGVPNSKAIDSTSSWPVRNWGTQQEVSKQNFTCYFPSLTLLPEPSPSVASVAAPAAKSLQSYLTL